MRVEVAATSGTPADVKTPVHQNETGGFKGGRRGIRYSRDEGGLSQRTYYSYYTSHKQEPKAAKLATQATFSRGSYSDRRAREGTAKR